MNKLFSEQEVRYMKLRSNPPFGNMTKIYYPKVSIKVFGDKNEDYLTDPTGWQAKRYVWKYE